MRAMKNDGCIEENPAKNFEKQGMKEVLLDIVIPTHGAIAKHSDRTLGTLAYFPSFSMPRAGV